jgi:glycosyltransferase involved in cell wall biosynthesis
MSLTIVITTFNRAQVLKSLLGSLAAQTDPDFQVVVAIDGSTDATEEMLNALDTPFPLRWVNTHCRGYGLAVARNLGILASTTELVAIIDDDCFPEADYVAAHKRAAKRKAITGGPRTPADLSDTRQSEKMRELARLPDCQPMTFERLYQQWPKAVATECNICMYKEDLVEIGLFSERLKIYGFIGQEFFARAKNLGFRYQYNHHAGIVHHRQPVGDNDLTRWRRKWQVTVAKALRPSLMNPDQYRAQIRWAALSAKHYPNPQELPPLPRSIWFAFPYRFVRNRAGDMRRLFRGAFRGIDARRTEGH